MFDQEREDATFVATLPVTGDPVNYLLLRHHEIVNRLLHVVITKSIGSYMLPHSLSPSRGSYARDSQLQAVGSAHCSLQSDERYDAPSTVGTVYPRRINSIRQLKFVIQV